MAYITPKTDWDTNPISPRSADFNRIEGNIEFLKNDIETKKGEIVNALVSLGFPASINNTYAELGAMISGIDLPSGNATVADVLSGKTFSKTGEVGLTGTMPDRSGDTAALAIARNGTTIRLRASDGYRDGTNDYVTHADANDVASNIKHNTTIRGLTGSFTGDADAVAADLSVGKIAYAKGAKLTGTNPRRATGTGSLTQVSATSAKLTVTGLSFTPSKIYLKGSLRARYTDSIYPEGHSSNYATIKYAMYENQIIPISGGFWYTEMPTYESGSTNRIANIVITASVTFQTGGFTVIFSQTEPDTKALDQYGEQAWLAIE